MKTNEIRSRFLDFFAARGHEIVPSSSLVPGNDPTLLFTNAGMVQFKDVFLGDEVRASLRATTSQRCVRAGGKHNDLENVGYTARHHTFFEMLGNFSFGDYFKRDAIRFAWELLTNEFGLSPDRLWVTVYQDDDEAAEIWLNDIGVSEDRFSRIDGEDNFWSMGETGPCGPCSEVFFDHGADVPGGPPGTPEEDGDRYVEIWNLVFMQYNREAEGVLNPLPKPSVDTGMGLERMAAVLQGVHSNYETDLFVALIENAAEVIGVANQGQKSLQVIADHIRSASFLIIDGVIPSNEGRGYVLRRIIRRAIRHGYQLGATTPFFHQLVGVLAQQMGEAYPELVEQKGEIEKVLEREGIRFAETLEQGLRILDQEMGALDGGVIPGAVAFKLYDTYGFPVDLTADVARERGFQLDHAGFDQAMAGQRERARAASQFSAVEKERIDVGVETPFSGYDSTELKAEVIALTQQGQRIDQLDNEQQAVVVLDQTPFYAESGGQVADGGTIGFDGVEFVVSDVQKLPNEVIGHYGTITAGALNVGSQVEARVDPIARRATASNHSATHLLHAALRRVLGDHVQQKGSLVEACRLRFDFSHPEPVEAGELAGIQELVNKEVRRNARITTAVMDLEKARESGAAALFGEKYGDQVRVVEMSDFSIELCGGTHASRTGDIGFFQIISEGGIAAGVRRIEAVTGDEALNWVAEEARLLDKISGVLKTPRSNLVAKASQLQERARQLEKEVQSLQTRLATGAAGGDQDPIRQISGVGLLVVRQDGADIKVLRSMVDQLKQRVGSGIVLLVSADKEAGKIHLISGVTEEVMGRIPAGDVVNHIASQIGGKGGGRPQMAQGGGSDFSRLDSAIASLDQWITDQVN
ncbi:MAG: alanine--tRNA ligase [Acidiferrobacteraceae bacterium]|jgi:alanyl-tRNA synthetase|nr:alanine--tRNA ligase [Acidiferrobacteraceae bacterium]MDP6433853.1 alanine--tRNA ligase [Arenicellales bacterium]MDP6672804.1 alanine--tRNA ligase [Arenicellales bacterium]MDP6723850.1 alanine--tRNA ligase [Arenicellales bacterium]|tara:strand:+ start:9156 stop:11762 length:2607 start_codon:yes stop_codon:yes gene_type:complete